jgi:hypothetical protein
MSRLTHRRAAALAAAAAVLLYLPALANGFAGDDLIVVRDNPAAHSVAAALAAWFEPYWHGEWQWAGLYRPLTILSYAIDWSIAGGAPWWLHLMNVVLHAAATTLVVAVLAPWLPPLGTLVAGMMFGLHPVHVEAVANIVGRAELLVAVALLGALLAARYHRRAESTAARWRWLCAVLLLVLAALFSKEHGVIAIALIAVDHVLDGRRAPNRMVTLYLGVSAVTVGWLYLWQHVAGAFVAGGSHAALYGLGEGARAGTMAPLYLDVVRLLVWPMRLLSDYAPLTVPVRMEIGWVALFGLTMVLAILALGVLAVRRSPAIAFGILVAVLSYAPTSNLIFVSGVMLAERNLYLAVLAPGAVAGWLVSRQWHRPERRAVVAALVALMAAYTLRTIDRIPAWKDSLTLVLEELVAQPGNYHTRVLLSDFLADRGDTAGAIAERLVAADLYPEQPMPRVEAAQLAIESDRPLLGLQQAEIAMGLDVDDPRIDEVYIRALLANGMTDAAVTAGLAGAGRFPGSTDVLQAYAAALADEAAMDRLTLVGVRLDWHTRRFVAVQAILDSIAEAGLQAGALAAPCEDVVGVRTPVEALRPDLWEVLTRASGCGSRDVLKVSQ